MQICFFEDDAASRLKPLTLTRPVDDLRIGILTITEKWTKTLQPDICSRITRENLSDLFVRETLDHTKPCVWVNGRFMPSETLISKIKNLEENCCLKSGNIVVAALTDPAVTTNWIHEGHPNFEMLDSTEYNDDSRYISNLWDLTLMNEQEIIADLKRIDATPTNQGQVSPNAILENRDQIFISKNAVVEAGATLIARKGPIFIGEEAVIQSGAIIRGTASIGHHSVAKMDARIYKGSTIGPVCKVNGEINSSIIHSYSNKAHLGYLGNSLIGQWCNLGAGTITSNLKNNYGHIRITDWESQEKVDTERQFFGTVMGDHTKTAINTRLNTGTMCGVCCNTFSRDFPPTFIPSFSWVSSDGIQPYKLNKALGTMRKMMARRNITLNDDYIKLMKHIFEER